MPQARAAWTVFRGSADGPQTSSELWGRTGEAHSPRGPQAPSRPPSRRPWGHTRPCAHSTSGTNGGRFSESIPQAEGDLVMLK